jgi:hypothetical protein
LRASKSLLFISYAEDNNNRAFILAEVIVMQDMQHKMVLVFEHALNSSVHFFTIPVQALQRFVESNDAFRGIAFRQDCHCCAGYGY